MNRHLMMQNLTDRKKDFRVSAVLDTTRAGSLPTVSLSWLSFTTLARRAVGTVVDTADAVSTFSPSAVTPSRRTSARPSAGTTVILPRPRNAACAVASRPPTAIAPACGLLPACANLRTPTRTAPSTCPRGLSRRGRFPGRCTRCRRSGPAWRRGRWGRHLGPGFQAEGFLR